MLMKTSNIKPDPDQPRRSFNKEKMEALIASMRADGFRKEYPIIVDGDNIIVDGERRWRSADSLGIKQVPVEVRLDVAPEEKLLYQLNSEGAELRTGERDDAHLKLYELGKSRDEMKYTSSYWANKRGLTESQFQSSAGRARAFRKVEKEIDTTLPMGQYNVMTEIGREKDPQIIKKMAKKAIKEDWSNEKVREIRKAVEEKPEREKEIFAQDYSDPIDKDTGKPIKGSRQWKIRLRSAKSDFDFERAKDVEKAYDHVEKQVSAYQEIIEHAYALESALNSFDYRSVRPEGRVAVHKALSLVLPGGNEWLKELEKYMIDNGELTTNNKKIGE